jgi:tyrosine-protein phosphatase SIW14
MIEVTSGLYRGPRPKSLRELRDKGIINVINLQSGIYELLHRDQYEGEQARFLGMTEFDFGLSDFSPPKETEVREIVRTIQFCQDLGEPVYVHCKHGKDRTGYVIAAYRIIMQGWSFNAAVQEMYEHGFHKFPYILWVPSLKKYEWAAGGA